MTSTSTALREIFTAARPLVEQWLDIAEQMAAFREAATAKGLDWSQVKSLLKAQVQDERDGRGDGKRVNRIIEKAEFASAYADMLGLGFPNMNENNFSALPAAALPPAGAADEGAGADTSARCEAPAPDHVPHDPETGEIIDDLGAAIAATFPDARIEMDGSVMVATFSTGASDPGPMPEFLNRRRATSEAAA